MRRRTFLRGVVGFVTASACGIADDSRRDAPPSARQNRIAVENALAGTSEWQITKLAERREIEGYTSSVSVVPGGAIDFMVSTSIPASYELKVFRIGWYGGLGGRLMAAEGAKGGTIGPLQGEPREPLPVTRKPDALVEARWPVSYRLRVPTSWPSGYYVVKLVREDGFERYMIFVVHDPSSRAPLLMQAGVTTWQAYNGWGGKSLYRTFGFDAGSRAFMQRLNDERAGTVSFDRPYATPRESDGAGEFFLWEASMVRWLERAGYDVTYATDVELHGDSRLLLGRKAFLSVGHDEYWSAEMRKNVTLARDEGVHLGFFGANTMNWRITLAPNLDEVPNRRIVCYKDITMDKTTVRWRDQGRPENSIVGVMNSGKRAADFVVLDPAIWVFEGSGLTAREHVRSFVGPEYDRTFANGSTPPGLTVFARSAVGDDIAESSIYTAMSGAIVFAAGTNQWPWALDGYRHPWLANFSGVTPHAGIERVTRNVIDRFLSTELSRTRN